MRYPWGLYILKSVFLSFIASAILVFLLSWGLYVMKWDVAGSRTAIRGVYFLSCVLGGFSVGKEFRQKRIIWGVLCTFIYAAVLMIASQLTGGFGNHNLSDAIWLWIVCIAGGIAGSIIS